MQYPPVKIIAAVVNRQVDYRAKRTATHFRNFFRCLDDKGQLTDDPQEISSIELTQRCKHYYDQQRAAPVATRLCA